MNEELSAGDSKFMNKENIVNNNQETVEDLEPLTFFQVMSSVFASAFGVQSSHNKRRDFTRGKPIHFVLSGILFTFGFLVMMIFIVNTVVASGS